MLTDEMLSAVRGDGVADLLFTNAKVVNVFSHSIDEGNVAVKDGMILGMGEYRAREVVDLGGKFLLPGLIDSHVHIESSLCTPGEYARTVVPLGTTTIVADPHEIANVCGIPGIRFMIEVARAVPLDIRFSLPSCVPASRYENSGAILDAASLKELAGEREVIGLGEVMDYPSVVAGDSSILAKIEMAKEFGGTIDGHSPKLEGLALNAYRLAGVATDHECSTPKEMLDRIARGMYVLIREGSVTRDLAALIPEVTPFNSRRCLFCSDDKHPADILGEGHIDFNIRKAIGFGLDPITAIQMATINAAECYRLNDIGAIAPGYRANMVIADDISSLKVERTYISGRLVAEGGRALFEVLPIGDSRVVDTVNLDTLVPEKLAFRPTGTRIQAITVKRDSVVTGSRMVDIVPRPDGLFEADGKEDLIKLAVLERHNRTGNIGIGFVSGFGLEGGALATSISHDAHNIIVAGDTDLDMCVAVNALIPGGGGMAIAKNGETLALLPLEVAGLMSSSPLEKIRDSLSEINRVAYEELGVHHYLDPFMLLSFLGLTVIPDLKLTDTGLFDVLKFDYVPVCPG